MVSVPSGFINKPKPKSVAEAVSQNSHDRLKTITKSALQSYIGSYLDTSGINRNFISATSPQGLTFVTDLSLQDSQDVQYRPTQLARMYNEIRQKTPAILIMDSGFQWTPAGLNGGLEAATNLNGKWQGYFRLFGRVPVTVAVVTKDQETTDTLMNVLMLIFDTFRNLAGGSLIYSKNPADSWVVRLPLVFEVGTNTAQEYEGDPVGRYWSSTIDMLIDVEDQVSVETGMITADVTGYVINSYDLSGSFTPHIIAPTTVRVNGGPFLITVPNYNPLSQDIIIDDPNIATLELGTHIYVTPYRTGVFNIKVVGRERAGITNPEAPFTNKELAKTQVTVIF